MNRMSNTPDPVHGDDRLARLMKLAGERNLPDAQRMERARVAAYESWQRSLDPQVTRSSRKRMSFLIALATAAGVAALALLLSWNRTDSVPVPVARVMVVNGGASIRSGEAATHSAIAKGAVIDAGWVVETGEGRVALALGDSLSLRLDRDTRVRFDDKDRVTLLEGAIYLDSGGLNAAPFLRIATPAGEVRHVGTQFQVRVAGKDTRVRVREGRVLVLSTNDRSTQFDVAAGEELRVNATRAVITRGMPSYGADWEWSSSVAPAFDIENRPLAEFLAWVIRENGWQLRYTDEKWQQSAHEIRLHGSISPARAGSMLAAVSMITGVPLEVRAGVLIAGRT